MGPCRIPYGQLQLTNSYEADIYKSHWQQQLLFCMKITIGSFLRKMQEGHEKKQIVVHTSNHLSF